jgi:hypothetical protein
MKSKQLAGPLVTLGSRHRASALLAVLDGENRTAASVPPHLDGNERRR